jgi:7,8-didemethyl-8-hydroxy-5-deazariboflavin synthase CofH subunit
MSAGEVDSKNDRGADLEPLRGARPDVRAILERALEGREVGVEDALVLDATRGADLAALCAAADALRAAQVGGVATYVVNRNVNFTNVCVKACRFCAFSRTQRSEEGYFLDLEEIVRRVVEARDLGATEVCIQAGLAPGMDPALYARICRAVKAAAPAVHIHAFSPEEIKYGAGLAKTPVAAFLEELRDAGLGSLPGTSAEILDDALRAHIAPGRIDTAEWIEIVQAAHRLGLPTTSTMMYGHVETGEHRVRHMALLRSLQRETGGFTEFVPLSFVAEEAPMYKRSLVRELRAGPTADDVRRVHALARVLLGASFRNVQVSWVKEGLERSTELLACGANDLGGTLINESISTSAGSKHGQRLSPAALRRAIRAAGRVPAQRDTRYRTLRAFEGGQETDPRDPLDAVPSDAESLGSYAQLTRDPRFRFVRAAAR